MFWRFGFSSTSSLDTLLDKPNVSLEEILDEDELLQECKTQNSKLLNYLQQPRVLKRLFEHVVGTAEVGGPGGREWEEKVRFKYPYICSEVLACDIWSIVDTALSNSDELLIPFWEAVLGTSPTGSQVSVPHHMHPLFASLPSTEPSSPRLNVANLPTVPGEERDLGDSNVGVLGLEIKREDDKRVTSARDNGPGKSVLAGYWAKVNGVFLDKKPKEMLEFIKAQPRIVEKLVAHLETPAVVDLLYRIIQCEESVPNAGVVDWLSSQDLINRVVDLLSPHHSTDLHNTVSELLKAIIALSAPSPASLTQNAGGAEAFGFGGSEGFGGTSNTSICGVNNRLVRELAGEPVVRKMVGFMLDFSLSSQLSRRLSQATEEQPSLTAAGSDLDRKPSVKASRMSSLSALSENPLRGGTGSSDESALDDEEMEEDRIPRRTPLNPSDTPASGASSVSAESAPSHRDSTAMIRPQSVISAIRAPQVEVTSESCTSSLVTSIGVLIELIRKNNSDYFEQHLFHTLRTHLLQRQQEIAERREKEKGEKGEVSEEEDDEMEGMEEAMAELSDKLGIVHLGPMLQILCERLPDFQELIKQPRSGAHTVPTSLGQVTALTFERYRITELYAELLHCSNMSLLNRARGEGPQYNKDGVLQGGIEGLQILARTLQGGDGASESGDATINDIGVPDAPSNDATKAISSEQPEVEAKSEDEAAIAAAAASSRSHSRDETKHKRESSTTGGGQSNGSEDTDDEALLSEVSLSDAAIAGGKASVVPVAEGGTGVEAAERETKTGVQAKDKENGAKKGADGGIEMALSNLSLAELTSPAPSGPPSPIDEQKKEFVVGDLLKNKFLESNVISTILSLFFQHPWNNFLHNVVYDILQQFFNGRMDVGLNRRLTLAVFDNGELTEKIVEGHQRNENSLQGPRKVRMGYMGHMNLIAEETVKLLERYPDEIEQHVQDHITPEWQAYVNETLKENREKEAAPLAGGRPQMSHPMGFPHQGGGGMELGGGISLGESGDTDAFANYLTSQMGAGNTSDDDDSDEDASWLAQDIKNRSGSGDRASGEHDLESGDGFEDVFEPLSHSGAGGAASGSADLEDDDDDEWGPFADSANVELAEADNQGISSAQAYLTPSQWASDFRRSTSSQTAPAEEEDAASAPTTNAVEGADDEGRRSLDSAESSNSTPLTDMLDGASHLQTDVVAAAHARRPSLGQHETVSSPPSLVGGIELKRRTSSSAGSSDPTAAHATDADEPLGPGVPADARSHEETGLIERIIDGRTIRVPLDDVALVSTQQANESAIVDQEEDEPVPDKAV